jgi:hypothetical protein
MTINRVTLENGNVQFEDYAASSAAPFVGMAMELPMCASGWTVGRFEVIGVSPHPVDANMVVAEARRVA